MKSAISSDLTSGAFNTLTTTEQSVLKKTSNIVNSSATQASVSTITNTITTSVNVTVKSSRNSNTSAPTRTPIQPSKTNKPWILY